MLFNSYVFILFFLPFCIVGYFIFNHFKLELLSKYFLLGMSLWFYGFFHIRYLAIIIASIMGNYIISIILEHIETKIKRSIIFFIALLFNIGILFYFKYFDFFLENINLLFKSNFALTGVLLPLGISFFTFQQVSYITDLYRGGVSRYPLVEYALFVSFFPQLIAGPIVTHEELIPQFEDPSKKHFQWDNFVRGIYIFVLGLGKKVLLADTFGNAVNIGFNNISGLDSTNAVIVMLAYTFQIYFDFSGYCDMAMGAAKMLNIDLPLNFNSPYKALTITEFWKRWHMTLTRFFTKYVYLPLGGNRKGKWHTYLNIMIVFMVSGLWHGANWTFILWGICHGTFSIITRYFRKYFDKLHPALNWIITFTFLNLTWVIFRADTIKDAARIIKRIFQLQFGAINTDIAHCFELMELKHLLNHGIGSVVYSGYPHLLILLFFVFAIYAILGSKNTYEKMGAFKPTIPRLAGTTILLVWCIFSFSGISTFLYFNF